MNKQEPIVLDESSLAEVNGGALPSSLSAISTSLDLSRVVRELKLSANPAVLGRVRLDRVAAGGSHPI